MGAYSLSDGQMLVRTARHTVELYLKSAKPSKEMMGKRASHLNEHHGIFVVIKHYPIGGLRGSGAFFKGVKPTSSLIVDAAMGAATEDIRHVPISQHELDHIVFEVGVISKPSKLLGPALKTLKGLKAGKEGVLLEYGYKSGFMLPEEISKSDKPEKIIEEVCRRAGLDPRDSKRHDLQFHKFTARLFREVEPSGEVEEVR